MIGGKYDSRQMQPRALLSDGDGHAPLSSLVTPVSTALQHLHGASGQVKGLSANCPGGVGWVGGLL